MALPVSSPLLIFLILPSFFLSQMIHAQESRESTSAQVSTTPSYSNTSDGLRQFLNEMLLAARRDDQSELLPMIRETEIPNYRSWFITNFGQETGESWAEPYGRLVAKHEKEFQELLVKLAHMDGEFAIEKMDTKNPLRSTRQVHCAVEATGGAEV